MKLGFGALQTEMVLRRVAIIDVAPWRIAVVVCHAAPPFVLMGIWVTLLNTGKARLESLFAAACEGSKRSGAGAAKECLLWRVFV